MGDGQPYIPIYFASSNPGLPSDLTQGGVKAVAEFAGRVWYGGFDGPLEGGDELSPNLSSYVAYSQQVKDFTDINKCYQVADPTDADDPERVATDGGFIRISGCSNIKSMINIGDKLVIFAETGVWSVGGTSNGQFDATNQEVIKISEFGILSPQSSVLVNGSVMYWSESGIYAISPTELGRLSWQEISVNIKSLYQGLPYEQKTLAYGIYDQYDQKVRWVYSTGVEYAPDGVASLGTGEMQELIFDLRLSAFTKNKVAAGLNDKPIVLCPVNIPPYNLQETFDTVVSDDFDVVTNSGDSVVSPGRSAVSGFRGTAYLTYGFYGGSTYFSTYNSEDFLDWGSLPLNGSGTDAEAYLLTGYIGTGDHARYKQVPYVYFHFNRTETGFTDIGNDLEPVGASSCLVQSQWDWTNSANSNKWGREFQAYRYKRPYIPSGPSDSYDNGQETIVTKNKLRGRGRVLSLKISSEPGKDLQLLGWSMAIGTNGNF